MPTLQRNSTTYGRNAKDLREEARQPDYEGARAAMESFYYAFNNRSMDVFDAVWADSEHISLDNPVGGIMYGFHDIRELYRQIFEGPARVWVEFYDIVEYLGEETVVFAGRERGEFSQGNETTPIAIRTSRVFQYFGPNVGWRQVHHHGSIDDADELKNYQRAVQSS